MTTERSGSGLAWGLISAVGYTAANVFLRGATGHNAAWVSGIKSVWTLLIFVPVLALLWGRGQRLIPSRSAFVALLAAAVLGQFGGNLAFQYALGSIGLAIAVPICLGTMITASAVLGRLWGHEPIRRQAALSIPVFLLSIVTLSWGRLQSDVAQVAWQATDDTAARSVLAGGCLGAALAGVSYSFLGYTIRRSAREAIPVASPMVIVGAVGAVGLTSVGWYQEGSAGIVAIPIEGWVMMSLAGIANAAAFLALSLSLKQMAVVYVHLLNSTQVAMAAVAGAVLFGESISGVIALGVGLSVSGFLILALEPRKPLRVEAEQKPLIGGPASAAVGLESQDLAADAAAWGETSGKAG